MRTILIGFAMATAVFGQAPAQPAMGQFEVKNAPTDQAFVEMANGVRTVIEMRDLSTDAAKRTVMLKGTTQEVQVAEWLLQQLDRPIDSAPSDSPQTRMDGKDSHGQPGEETVKVFYLKHTANVQDFVEIANSIRTVVECRRLFTYNAAKAIMIRDIPEKAAAIEWLVGQLDQPADLPRGGDGGGYTGLPDRLADTLTRILYVKNAKDVQEFVSIANAIRTTSEVRRLFTVNVHRAILLRDDPDKVAMIQWLLNQIDQPPAQNPSVASYRVPGAADDIVQVFHLTNPELVQQFRSGAAEAMGKRIFVFDTARAVMLRGNTSQIAVATQLIHDLEPR